MTRAIGLRKGVSPSMGLQNIVLRRFIGFVSGGSPGGSTRTMLGGREKEKRRETLKRGRCDYEGGDAGGDAKLFESKAGKSQRREFGLERTYVCNYAVSPSPGGRETCIPRVFRSVHFSGSSGGRRERESR